MRLRFFRFGQKTKPSGSVFIDFVKKIFHRFGFSLVRFLKLFCFEIMTELSFYLTACQTGRYEKIFPLVQLGSVRFGSVYLYL
jgi:hypothetical protein